MWTRRNFERLYELFVENPDESDDDFLVKLQRQLEPGPPDAKCLWAEMSWVYHLIQRPGAMKPTTKKARIREIWGWSGRELPEDHELLSDSVLGSGIITTGNAYGQLSWKEYMFFVAAMRAWFSKERNWRDSILGDPWQFASWLDDQEHATNRMFRHAVLFLLFPDDFEPIVSTGNKRKIVKRLYRGDRPDASDAVAVDRALLAIRKHLEEEHPGFSFYRPPVAELWEDRSNRGKTGTKPERRRTSSANASYSVDDAHRDVFVPRADFERILSSIGRRKNLILQGPPGTGKTFLARRIAWCLMGRKDNGPIKFVQFHQSYAYEDFVQGFRPVDRGGFERKDGVFLRFCRRALDSNVPHVLIIDEINRGNLSRIFGELLMLIEADKRSEDYAVALTYSSGRDKPFFIPANLYILGTMNTADRSLAVVDYALRRRFAFETLEPAFATRQGRLEFERCLRAKGAAAKLVARISRGMVALNERISDDKELGRGFQIGHSYFVPGDGDKPTDDWYEDVVDTQIAPLLREYWFDSPQDVETEVGRLKAV